MKDNGEIGVSIKEGHFIFYKFRDGCVEKDTLLFIKEILLDISDPIEPIITVFYEKCFTLLDVIGNTGFISRKSIETILQIAGETTIINPLLCHVALNFFPS
jgi:hypothetical protein